MKYRILKEEEYEKHKFVLPNPNRRFWIESSRELGPKRCGFVNDEGTVDRNGTYCSDTTLWIRPVIEYEKDEKKDIEFSEGKKVILHGLEWTAISDTVLVCDRCVEDVKFDDSTTDFENSYLKYAIYQYFRKRSSVEAITASSGKQEADLTATIAEAGSSSGIMLNLAGMLTAGITGVICTLSFSPVAALIGVAASLGLGIFNISKIKKFFSKKKSVEIPTLGLTTEPEMPAEKNEQELKLSTGNITDSVICGKTAEINKLIDALIKTGNRTILSKVKFFYLPETQKTLELYDKIQENGIDTPNSKECLDIISENLDKTIRLLRIEYDKASADDVLDARLQSGIIGKMLDDAEKAENLELKL